MSTIEVMRQKLAALSPLRLEIVDQSAKHAGHAGAGSGGHYELLIVSEQFRGKPQLACHRMIFELLAEMMQKEIHALRIRACAPE